jgi:hypothetical protein
MDSMNWREIPFSNKRYSFFISSIEKALRKLETFQQRFPTMDFFDQINKCKEMQHKLMAFAPLESVHRDLTSQEFGLLMNKIENTTLVQLNTLHIRTFEQLQDKLFDFGLVEFVGVSNEPTKRWNAVEFYRDTQGYLGSGTLSEIDNESAAVSLTPRGQALIGLSKRLRK